MDAVFANFDEYLKAFGLTIGLFVDPGHTTPELPPKPNWEPKPANRSGVRQP